MGLVVGSNFLCLFHSCHTGTAASYSTFLCWTPSKCPNSSSQIPYSSKFSRHKNFVKHSKFAKFLIFVLKISWLLQSFARHG